MSEKIHWVRDYSRNKTACGRYDPSKVTCSTAVEAISCAACKKAVVREFNVLMDVELPTPAKFLRVENSICMRAEEPSKLIYVLFDAPAEWARQGQSPVIQQYADEIVELLNERYG